MQEAAYKIYNASAGSGKTFTLVRQYLKIVLSSDSHQGFRQILAITFTNKAVNEMKQRILNSLFHFSETTDMENAPAMFHDISTELNISPEALRQRAKKTLKEILHNYAFFDVSTIDKFTHRLIRTFAKDLKLPQNFEVVLDTDLLLDEAVARLINNAGSNEQLTKVLLDFALEKIDDDKSWDISIDLNKMGKLLFDENHSVHLKKLENKGIADFLGLKKIILAKIKSVELDAIQKAKTVLGSIQDQGLEPSDFPRQTLPNHFKKIAGAEFEPIKLYNNKLEHSLVEGHIVKSGVEPPPHELAAQILEVYLDIKDLIYHRSFLKNSYKNIVPLTVLNAIHKEVKAIELLRDQLPISSFNTIISDAIKDQPAPFIYERLGEKYRHYFLDEFQDTSEMQWKNLVPLIGNALESENEQGQKGSLLLVGDAKQAIYRWRGGKAEQFLNLIDLGANPFVIPPKTKNLPANYRSHEEIIKFNNDFFTTTSPFLNSKLYQALFVEGNRQRYNAKKGGAVQLTFIEKDNEADEDEIYCNHVLMTIQEIQAKKYILKDICILTRKRRQGVRLADFLTQQNIPVISSETLLLNSSPKVKFLVNLLKYTDRPQDLETSYDILYFLIAEKEDKHGFIQKHLEGLKGVLQDIYSFDLEYLKRSSVYDGLEYAMKQFRLVEGSDAYLTYLMDVVLEVEQKEGTSMQAFLEHWEKKKDKLSITAPENVDAVQIMTIHKSKGLEFPIVVFPYANSNIYEEIEPKLWIPVQKEAFNGFGEVLVNKKQEVVHYGAVAENLYREEQHKLELDAFNLLYVALTRAVKALYIITKKDLTSKGEHKSNYYSGLFIHYLKEKGLWKEDKNKYSFGTLDIDTENVPMSGQQKSISYPYSFKDRPSFGILVQSGVLWESEREDAISKGNLIHNLLGLIETEKDLDHAVDTMVKNGDIALSEIDYLKTKILQIIHHPKLKPYYEEGNTVKNERDIIMENGLFLRPDRVVIKDHRATIIDYKTGKKNPSHEQQLYEYASALETMGYPIEHKIIVYIDKNITPEFI